MPEKTTTAKAGEKTARERSGAPLETTRVVASEERGFVLVGAFLCSGDNDFTILPLVVVVIVMGDHGSVGVFWSFNRYFLSEAECGSSFLWVGGGEKNQDI